MTYGTTAAFLDHFGLESIGDLPGLEELKGAGLLDMVPPGSIFVTPDDRSASTRTRTRWRRAVATPSPICSTSAEPTEADTMPTAAAEIRHDRPPRLAYERVSHSFTGLAAVDDVSLSVESGEILCLLGPSGCGKTTLLRIAAGIERQKAGRVVIDGEEVAGPNRMLPPEARGIGLVFQDYALFPHLTILDNVRFGLAGRPAGAATETAMRALERVRLAHYAKSLSAPSLRW